jgi:transposase
MSKQSTIGGSQSFQKGSSLLKNPLLRGPVSANRSFPAICVKREGRAMMGRKDRAFAPLIKVSLEQLVPADHFYRHLDHSLDLTFVRDLVAPFYAAGGRPSVDPIVFFKLQLIMFFEGLRSERHLMRTAADRLSLRWYLGYDFHESLPDHSSLTRIRERYGLATFRHFFEHIVAQCQQAGLVWGQELYFDGTPVEANADADTLRPRFYVEAMQAHLAALFADQSDPPPTNTAPDLPNPNLLAFPSQQPPAPGEPVPLDEPPGADWIDRVGRPASREQTGSYQRIGDLRVSTTDPDATLLRDKGGGSHLGYQTHYVVDGGKARIILNVLVTPAEVQDNQPMLDLLWRTCFRWHLWPKQVTGDTKYGTIENLKAIEDAGMRAYIPLRNFEDSRGGFGKQRFTYEAEADQYRCPQGEVLRLRASYDRGRMNYYRANPATCNGCALKSQCTTSEHGREVGRSYDEEYVERVRAYQSTAAYQKALGKRQVWVEPLFGEAKQWHGLERFRLRGLEKVNSESLLIAAGQNLKRLLVKWGWGRRPGPNGAPLAVGSTAVGALFAAFSALARRGVAIYRKQRGRSSAARAA